MCETLREVSDPSYLIGQLVIQLTIEINRPAIHCAVSPRC